MATTGKESAEGSRVEDLIQNYKLEPHPEGGFFSRWFASEVAIPKESLGDGFSGPRPAATSIYFLLRPGDISRMHKLVCLPGSIGFHVF